MSAHETRHGTRRGTPGCQWKTPRGLRTLLVSCIVAATAFVATVTTTPSSVSAGWVFTTYIGATTATCPNGRVCINLQTVNGCGGAGNICHYWNANGGAGDFASNANTNVTAPAVYSGGERMRNRNSGTGRPVCGSSQQNHLGTTQLVSYYGASWVAMPFTGVRSFLAIPTSLTSCPTD